MIWPAALIARGRRVRRARDIDGGKGALVQQKAVREFTADLEVEAYDLLGIIDRPGLRVRRARGIDDGEGALVPQKAVGVDAIGLAAIGLVDAHDLAGRIYRPGLREYRARGIDGGEG